MKTKAFLATGLLGLALFGTGAARAASDPMDSQTAVARGVWCSSFTDAKASADKENVPMLVFWANPGCSQCEKLETACKKDDFKAWMAKRQLVFVFGYGATSADMKACKAFVKNSSQKFPYMGVYWKANTKGTQVYEKFTGRSGTMDHGASSSQALGDQLMTAVDNILADWDPSGPAPDPTPDPEPEPEPVVRVGGAFVVPDTDGSRLEAIAGVTASVVVPLARTNATHAATNVLTAVTGGVRVAQDVVWAVGESEKSVTVATAGLSAGETVTLELALGGVTVATSAIHGVTEGANAPANPKFLGEDFGYGEWTLDYDWAKAKAAADPDAKLVVMFSGPLWCPYCEGIETGLLNTDAFRRWAVANKVFLTLFDQGRATTPKTAMGERGPRLTTYDPDPTKAATGVYVSGAAYRSRKGVTEAQAVRLMNQTAAYTQKWLEPGSSAARCSNPTILLVDPKTEAVCARLNAFHEKSSYALEENIERLDALLKKGGTTEADGFPATTTLSHVIATTNAVSLDVNAAGASYRLVSPRAGELTFSLTETDGHAYTFSVYTDTTGLVASGVGGVTYLATADDAKAGLSVKVSTTFGKGERTAQAAFTSAWRAVDTDNEFVSQAFSAAGALVEDGVAKGTLSISSSSKGKARVSYYNAVTGKTTTFTGYWSEPDEDGTAFFSVAKSSGAIVCSLEMSGAGEIAASVHDTKTAGKVFELSGAAHAAAIDYEDFADVYTVALPFLGDDGDALQRGSGYVLVKAGTTMAKKYGRATCIVFLPNGTSKTTTAQMTPGADGFANLTITVKSGLETAIVPLAIRPNAAQASTHRAVVAPSGCAATWASRDKKAPFLRAFGVYGSRYDKKESLVDCCGTSELTLAFDRDGDVASALGDGLTFALTDRKIVAEEKISKFSLSFNRTSGKVYGKTVLTFTDGTTASAKLRGVFFPDWYDCGCFEDDELIPLGTSLAHIFGTCYFTDKVDGKSVSRSIPFTLKAVE